MFSRKAQYDSAIADYDQAISLEPKYADAYSGRGLVWFYKGEYDRAIADCGKAINLSPKDARAFECRGLVRQHKADYNGAFGDYDEAIRFDPKNADVYGDRGMLNFYSSSLVKAQADFEQATALQADNAYYAMWLDLARRHNGQSSILRDAKLDMTKWPAPLVRMLLGDQTPEMTLAAADDPDSTTKNEHVCEANVFVAEFHRLQHRDEEALRFYRLAVRDCPRSFIEYTAATNALRAMGKAP